MTDSASVAPADCPPRTSRAGVQTRLARVRADPVDGARDVALLVAADGLGWRQPVVHRGDRPAALGEPPVQRGAVAAVPAGPRPAVHPHHRRVRTRAGRQVEVQRAAGGELDRPVGLPVGLAQLGQRRRPVQRDALLGRGPALRGQHRDRPDDRRQGEHRRRDAGEPGTRGSRGQPEQDPQHPGEGDVQWVGAGQERPREPDRRGLGAERPHQHDQQQRGPHPREDPEERRHLRTLSSRASPRSARPGPAGPACPPGWDRPDRYGSRTAVRSEARGTRCGCSGSTPD